MNRAAFSPADVEDAKRGHPAVSLAPYAAERGLEYLDGRTPGGYRTAVPGDDKYQFNVLRGPLPGGEFGVVAHEALEVPWVDGGLGWSGDFQVLDWPKGDGVKARDFALALLPYGDLFTGWGSPKEVQPMRVPCTVAAVRVPETAGVQPHLRIDNREAAPPYDFGNEADLGPLGLSGWLVHGDPAPPRELLEPVLAGPIGQILTAHDGDALFQLLVTCATLVVRRNGYITDPAQLDELCHFTGALGFALRAVCGSRLARQPFDQPLPPPAWVTGEPAQRGFALEPAWQEWAQQHAAKYGLTLESTVAYHRAFPSIPVPGFAKVVMRGELPIVGLPGRLVVHQEPGAARGAVVIEAPAGWTSGPDGDRVDGQPPVRREVRGGLVGVWSMTSYWGNFMAGDIDALLAAAASALRG